MGLFLSYANWKQNQDDIALKNHIAVFSQHIDEQVKLELKARLAAKQKLEADAKAKSAEAEANIKQGATSQTQTTNHVCDITDASTVTVIINKKHCFNPKEWAPSDLDSVEGYPLRAEAARNMVAMMNAAATSGVGFSLSSAYRSYYNQVTTYNNWVAVNGSTAAADTVSARPGYSEHQTGLAADLKEGGCVLECFGGTQQYAWLKEHAHEYGFIERYPEEMTAITGYSPEAWHWRYVGSIVATDMKQKNIVTLEAYFGITGGDY
jgi:D-alanyl-D-alanine carboxypeptidase